MLRNIFSQRFDQYLQKKILQFVYSFNMANESSMLPSSINFPYQWMPLEYALNPSGSAALAVNYETVLHL